MENNLVLSLIEKYKHQEYNRDICSIQTITSQTYHFACDNRTFIISDMKFVKPVTQKLVSTGKYKLEEAFSMRDHREIPNCSQENLKELYNIISSLMVKTGRNLREFLKFMSIGDIHFRLEEFDVVKDGKIDKISIDRLKDFYKC